MNLVTKIGRKVLVQSVLTSMLIYMLIAIDLPPWDIIAVDKIRHGFIRKVKGMHRKGNILLHGSKYVNQLNWVG